MNTPSPLKPLGMLPDNHGKSHVRIAVFTILAIHVVLLGALLLQGCKRTTETSPELASITNNYAPPPTDTNPPPLPPPLPTAPPGQPVPPPTQEQPIAAPPPPVAPSAETSTLPAAAANATEHVVVKGDSFYTIAKKYGVSTKAIAAANPGVDSTKLKIGQRLVVPAAAPTAAAPQPPGNSRTGATAAANGRTYTVKSGDTLSKIAREQGVSIRDLRAANHLKVDRITVGQKLKIPSKGSAPATAPGSESSPAGAPASPGGAMP